MKDTEANIALIKHVNRRVEEFFDEYPPENFSSLLELQNAFARFVRRKEKHIAVPKDVNGVIGIEMDSEDVVDEHSSTVAFVKMFKTGKIGLLWSPILFTELPMPDELREALVSVLRFHADRLESREIDRRMKELTGRTTGAA